MDDFPGSKTAKKPAYISAPDSPTHHTSRQSFALSGFLCEIPEAIAERTPSELLQNAQEDAEVSP
jgi:hypothetical protein